MRRLLAILDPSAPPESVGLRLSVARELSFRVGEPVYVADAHDEAKRVWLPGWWEVADDQIGPDGCLLSAEVVGRLSELSEGVYVHLRSGRSPQPSFFTFSWTYEEPEEERPPEDLLVLLDTSSSMGGTPLRNAQRALYAFVDRKRELALEDRLGLVTFGGDAETGVEVVCLPVGEAAGNYDEFVRAVGESRPAGQTPMAAALEKALEILESLPDTGGAPRRRRLLLITDGHPCPRDPDGIEALIERFESERVYLATVGVGEFFDRDLLTSMAARTRAPFVEVHQIRQLPYLLETLA